MGKRGGGGRSRSRRMPPSPLETDNASLHGFRSGRYQFLVLVKIFLILLLTRLMSIYLVSTVSFFFDSLRIRRFFSDYLEFLEI